MEKLSIRTKVSILLFFLVFILACNMPIAEIVENPLNEPTTEENDQEIQQINAEIDSNFEGTQTYRVKPLPGANNSSDCKPGYEFGDRWTRNSISRFDSEENWDRSQIKIESGQNNVLTYQIVIKEKPNTFCRLNEQNFVECVYLDTDGYTVRVFNDPPFNNSFVSYVLDDPKTCYTMVFEDFEQPQRLPPGNNSKDFIFTAPPDVVEISLWGPIPAMSVTSNKTGQTYEKGHDAHWTFMPKVVEDWDIFLRLNTNDESITGYFSGEALYHEEEPLYVIDGKAIIIGTLLDPMYTSQQGEVITVSNPIRMNFTGNVHEPNQYAANADETELDFLVYHDVDFDIRVVGALKIILSNNETYRVEIEVNDCKNSKFSSTNEGAQLTKCSVLLVWDNLPLN